MNERDKILGRIREALRIAAPRPGHGGEAFDHGLREREPSIPSGRAREWLPAVGESFKERLALFENNAADLKVDFHLLSTREDLCTLLLQLAESERWKKIATHA